MRVRLLISACLLFAVVAGAQEPTLRQRIETELSNPRGGSVERADLFTAEWGAQSIPIMLELLEEPAFRESEAKILVYLAATAADAALAPIVAAIRRAENEDNLSLRYAGYYALGTLATPRAREFLVDAAADAAQRDTIINLLGLRHTPATLEALRAIRERYGASANIDAAIATEQREIAIAEDLAWARGRTDFDADAAAAFWARQTTLPNLDLADAIVGRYEGMVYRARESPLPVAVEFGADGSLRSTFSFARDGEGPFEGVFAVPSPTQLIVAPGRGVTTFDVDLRGDTLSFRLREVDAHFVLRREGAAVAREIEIDARAFAGPYRGTAYHTKEPDNELGAVEGVEVVFGRSGAIDTNFGNDNGGLYSGFNSAKGDYTFTPSGRLVTTFSYGGGDYFGYTANGFYDWLWRDGQLYFSMFHGGSYGSIHVATPNGAPVVLHNEEALRTLAAGPYVGVAYRAAPRGIGRIADLRIEFRRDGTYRLDSRSRLRPRNAQYWPRDEGPYFLLTERHLYLGRAWSDGGLTAAGIADVQVEGDRLSFTSFEDDAYFVFERE